MNRPIRLVGIGLIVLFLALFIQLNYLQVFRAGSLQANPLNTGRIVKEYDAPRGDIVSADGVTLAHSVRIRSGEFKHHRVYPTGSLFGQITGYFSFTYGDDGVERTYNDLLTGSKTQYPLPTSLSNIRSLLLDANAAQTVTLTLSDKLQTVAKNELAGRAGSVVALDPRSGAILAMYSNPSFDPNRLSALNQVDVQKSWKSLLKAPGNPLSSGAYRNRWFPGSTFKVITASAVLDHDPSLATQTIPLLSALPLPDTTNLLHNFGGETCGGALPELLTVSCDTGFGKLGLELGGQRLYEEARAFGFDESVPLDLPDPAQSFFPSPASFQRDKPSLAYSAIGQQDVQATPLQMAMVAGAIANHGRMMTPHVLENVRNAQDQVVSRFKSSMWQRATGYRTASRMTKLMESVVDSPNGTGVEARIPGVEVAAKTGTAQTGTGKIDAWFIAFAPGANPGIAVAVVLPDQPSQDEFQGGTLAAPIAKAMIESYLAGAGRKG